MEFLVGVLVGYCLVSWAWALSCEQEQEEKDLDYWVAVALWPVVWPAFWRSV